MGLETEQQAEEPVNVEEAVGTGNSDRINALNAIGDRIDSERGDDMLDIADGDKYEQFDKPEIPDEEHETETTQEKVIEDKPATPDKYKLKVSGKEIELTLDEIIERAQKVEAADAYLSEAARLKKEYETRNAPPKPSEDAKAVEVEESRALARAIQMGTEDEAVEAIARLRKSVTPSFSKDELARTVDERLTFQNAVSVFQDEYKDIYSDPKLRQMVIDQDAALVASGDTRTYLERYRSIGQELRDWRDSLVKSVAAPDKQTRKSAAPSPVAAAGAKVKSSHEDDDIEESASQVIAKMAKARGGPQWMNS